MRPTTTVILSTYNSPDWLEKVLWGYSVQTDRSFDVIVADDGSTNETRERIDAVRGATGLSIAQVWHPDRGFRKCAILNRAIEAARGEYLIFSDGDCIPRADFVAAHRDAALPQRFLSGGYFKLTLETSRAISLDDVRAGHATDIGWLRANGQPWTLKALKLSARGRFATILDRYTSTRASWNGHNASGWKRDLTSVNGFDERMEYGGEDRELGERLINRGIRGVRMRYRAACVHLEHARGYVREEALKINQAIRDETHRSRATWTNHGIATDDERTRRAA